MAQPLVLISRWLPTCWARAGLGRVRGDPTDRSASSLGLVGPRSAAPLTLCVQFAGIISRGRSGRVAALRSPEPGALAAAMADLADETRSTLLPYCALQVSYG